MLPLVMRQFPLPSLLETTFSFSLKKEARSFVKNIKKEMLANS